MTTPKPYQRDGAWQIQQFGGVALLAGEMGTGKTFEALYWLTRRPSLRPCVVVCPASLKLNWQAEASMHCDLRSEVLEGRKVPRNRLHKHHPILILNYEILPQWLEYLIALKPQVVVFDESHRVKSRTAQCTKAMKALCRVVPHRIALSGTPLTNRPAELWSTLNMLRPALFESFYEFAQEYCEPKKMPWGWEYNGARNIPQLHALLKETVMIRHLKKDVLKDLPAKQRFVVPMQLSDRKEYDDASNNFLGWLMKESKSRALRAQKSLALVKVGYLLRLVARLKVKFIYDWIDNFLEGSDKKLVVFTMHRRMIELLHARYGAESVVVDGQVNQHDRHRAVQAFQHDKRVRLFLGNVRAAGVGITLTASHNVCFADLPWTPGELVQAEDRIHRIGQKETANIYFLIAPNTVEEKLCKLLQTKQTVLDGVLDGGANVDPLSILDELIKGFL